jgi:hypothetical protein
VKILFDQGAPVPLRRHLTGHNVSTVFELGWARLENGELLEAAERDGFDFFLTTDQNLRYQQNLTGRQIAVCVLMTTSWSRIKQHTERVRQAIENAQRGDYIELSL